MPEEYIRIRDINLVQNCPSIEFQEKRSIFLIPNTFEIVELFHFWFLPNKNFINILMKFS